MEYTLDDYLKFITEYIPHFNKNANGKYEMFTVPTQWIEGNTIKELLDKGIETAKELNGKSPWHHLVGKIENESNMKFPYGINVSFDEFQEYLYQHYFK